MAKQQHRHSIRLPAYDYAQPGAYFITICVEGRVPFLGAAAAGASPIGSPAAMVERWWHALEEKYPQVQLDEFVIMPDHVHGILFILGDDQERSDRLAPIAKTRDGSSIAVGAALRGRPSSLPAQSPVTLGQIVGWFKAMTTNEYIRHVRDNGWPAFDRRLWQRNYFEHVVRNEVALDRLRRYIMDNPTRLHDGFDQEDVSEIAGYNEPAR